MQNFLVLRIPRELDTAADNMLKVYIIMASERADLGSNIAFARSLVGDETTGWG